MRAGRTAFFLVALAMIASPALAARVARSPAAPVPSAARFT